MCKRLHAAALYGEKMSKLKKAVACASALLGAAFTALSAVAAVKRADSRYENEPAEKNPLEGEKVEFEVSGDKIEAVYMIPGWTHNIINLSDTQDLVTIMTCNEVFDINKPDTFAETV